MKRNRFRKRTVVNFLTKFPLIISLCVFLTFCFTFISCTPPDDTSSESTEVNEEAGNPAENETEENNEEGNETDPEASEESTDAGEENEQEEEAADTGGEGAEAENGEILINVYYADGMGEYLVGEARAVSAGGKYVDALNEMMKLPVDSSLYMLVPDTTKINSVTVEDGIAKVDLSKNFVEDRFQSETVDILLIYSVVNTLTEFPEVNAVDFYIDGEKLDLLGEIDIKDHIFRRSDLIKDG